MIKTGRYGTVKWSAAPGSPAALKIIASLNAWKLSMKTTKEDVTCFGDPNKVYVPGIPDISGTLGGFFNGSELTLVAAAATGTAPGMLALGHNSFEPSLVFSGPAYMDADIDCSLAAPKIAGTFNAAGPWTVPSVPVP